MSAKTISIPPRALVILMGPSGAGKSTFAACHGLSDFVVSSDVCRKMVSDDVENQECNAQAFTLFHTWIEQRLKLGRVTIADATNLKAKSRKTLVELANKYRVPAVLICFESSLGTCKTNNKYRPYRSVPEDVIERHYAEYEEAKKVLDSESYRDVHPIDPVHQPYVIKLESSVYTDSAPGFDVIGDLHGCADELEELLALLGYESVPMSFAYTHPAGRKLVFVGDITDRGPNNTRCLDIVLACREAGHISVAGNHDDKLRRALKGNQVKMAHGLQGTWAELQGLDQIDRDAFRDMLEATPYQAILYVEDQPDLIVCHAGLPKRFVGADTKEALNHALYGEILDTAGKYPVRGQSWVPDWESGLRKPYLVHGHTVSESPWYDAPVNICNVDGGAVFGGELRAFRWPQREIVSVAARKTYCDKK